jgi:nucleoside-diphosphate-sugar epimerase
VVLVGASPLVAHASPPTPADAGAHSGGHGHGREGVDVSRRTYLVTGGTGFLGSALVKRLVSQGHCVRVLDDNSRGRAARLSDLEGRYEYVPADVRDPAAVARACEGVDMVCHLAFVNGTEFFYAKPELVLDVAVKGMTSVLDGCRLHRVPELFLMSSSEVYQSPPKVPTDETTPLSIPDPLNARYSYAGGKIISELMAINYGRTAFRRVVIVRPHNVYGADMGYEHVIPQFALRMRGLRDSAEDPVPFPLQGSGEQTRSFVYVDDFTDGVMLALDRGEHLGIYHVGTLEEVTMRDLAERVGESFGRRIRVVPGEAPKGGTNRRCPDISKIAALGYAPRFRLSDALPLVTRWYDQHPPAAR